MGSSLKIFKPENALKLFNTKVLLNLIETDFSNYMEISSYHSDKNREGDDLNMFVDTTTEDPRLNPYLQFLLNFLNNKMLHLLQMKQKNATSPTPTNDEREKCARYLFYFMSILRINYYTCAVKDALLSDDCYWKDTLKSIIAVFVNWGTTVADLDCDENIEPIATSDQLVSDNNIQMKNTAKWNNFNVEWVMAIIRSKITYLDDNEKGLLIGILAYITLDECMEKDKATIIQTIDSIVDKFNSNEVETIVLKNLKLHRLDLKNSVNLCQSILLLNNERLSNFGMIANHQLLLRFGILDPNVALGLCFKRIVFSIPTLEELSSRCTSTDIDDIISLILLLQDFLFIILNDKRHRRLDEVGLKHLHFWTQCFANDMMYLPRTSNTALFCQERFRQMKTVCEDLFQEKYKRSIYK